MQDIYLDLQQHCMAPGYDALENPLREEIWKEIRKDLFLLLYREIWLKLDQELTD